jgi:hypothetical protein
MTDCFLGEACRRAPNSRSVCAAELAILENDEMHCRRGSREKTKKHLSLRLSKRVASSAAATEAGDTDHHERVKPEAARQGERLWYAAYARWDRRCVTVSFRVYPPCEGRVRVGLLGAFHSSRLLV